MRPTVAADGSPGRPPGGSIVDKRDIAWAGGRGQGRGYAVTRFGASLCVALKSVSGTYAGPRAGSHAWVLLTGCGAIADCAVLTAVCAHSFIML